MQITFDNLGVSEAVCEALRREGFEAPFRIQELVLGDAMEGVDILAKSRTGSGKTLAFAIPIVEQLEPGDPMPSALILVPTRELAVQVTEAFELVAGARHLRVASVYGGVDLPSQAKEAQKAHIIVATPGRLEDLANRRLLSLGRIRTLVLDEADRMLDMGFYPQVNQIVSRVPKERQTMFFSATLDGQVGHLARAYTKDPVHHEVVDRTPTVEQAEHQFIAVDQSTKAKTLATVLEDRDDGLALVFVRTKRGADNLVTRMKQHGVKASTLHGDMTQAARQRALERFEAGRISTLVATDVAARGLDLAGITLVVNYDPPDDDKSYVHRVGRTARAGRTGKGVTLVLPDQRIEVSRMADRLKLGREFEEGGMVVAPPTLVYSSRRGGKGSFRGSRPRRK